MSTSVPFITPADPLPVTTSVTQVTQSAFPQVPLVQTQVLPTVSTTQVVGTPAAQYVPVISQVRQTRVASGVRVVPIYD